MLRERLAEAIRRVRFEQGEFAERAGVDRTTLSQLLSPANVRLPARRHARGLGRGRTTCPSTGWSGCPTPGRSRPSCSQHTSFEAPGPSPTDERLLGWFGEAADYKIRYVPATLPDLLKTDAVIRFERSRADGPDVDADDRDDGRPAGVGPPSGHRDGVLLVGAGDRVVRPRRGHVEPARRRGAAGAARPDDRARRRAVPDVPLVPVRRFRRYAAPVTVFGPQRAALYLGQLYLVLTSAEHVRTLSRHFDWLIRDADVQPTSMGNHLARLRKRV